MCYPLKIKVSIKARMNFTIDRKTPKKMHKHKAKSHADKVANLILKDHSRGRANFSIRRVGAILHFDHASMRTEKGWIAQYRTTLEMEVTFKNKADYHRHKLIMPEFLADVEQKKIKRLREYGIQGYYHFDGVRYV